MHGDVAEALGGVDVLVEFTSHEHAKAIALAAIEHGVAVVIGSSGLTAADYADVDAAAREAGVGVVASGNYSLTAAMMLAGAELAARHLPQWEIIDYAKSTKPDAPSGTANELAERLQEVREPKIDLPPDQVAGRPDARGANVAGTQVHSIRVPSFVVSTEIVFGAPDERLSPAPRRRRQRRPLRRRGPARGPQGPRPRRAHPRPRPAARGLSRAISSPASQPGARPPAGGRSSPAGRPAIASSQAITEFEFHMSPVRRSSRPQTSLGTSGSRSRSRRATSGSPLRRRGPPTASPRSGITPPGRQRTS